MRTALLASAAFAAILPAVNASAEHSGPGISGAVVVELQTDATFSADDPAAELVDTRAKIEAAIAVDIHEAFGFGAVLVFEPVKDPVDDRFFEDHGLYAEELFARVSLDQVDFRIGKINPKFAIGWDAAPGLYGVDFAEDYQLTEQIGVDAEIPFQLGDAEHVFSAALFFADTTGLSRSAFLDRGRTTLASGGAGNTESLESVALALDGEIEGFGYSIGLRRRAEPDAGGDAEFGGSFALFREFEVEGGDKLSLLGEATHLSHSGGGADDAFYFLAGAAYEHGPLTASTAYTLRDANGAGTTDHLATASLEYGVCPGVGVGIGYKYEEAGGLSSHTVGFQAVFEREY